MSDDLCPKDCKYLNVTEKRQNELMNLTGMHTKHKCLKYNQQLYHMLAYPDLYKCEECYKDSIKSK